MPNEFNAEDTDLLRTLTQRAKIEEYKGFQTPGLTGQKSIAFLCDSTDEFQDALIDVCENDGEMERLDDMLEIASETEVGDAIEQGGEIFSGTLKIVYFPGIF